MTERGWLVLLRHGESTWNAQRRFTGWRDPSLSERGHVEGQEAGDALLTAQLSPDLIFTSVLTRAEQTVAAVTGELRVRAATPPAICDWRLNERHYGALQGLKHDAARERYGADAVETWRRSWSATPPELDVSDPRHPAHDPRYSHVPLGLLPSSESLAACLARQLPCFTGEVAAAVLDGARVLLVGHGNALRALVAHLEWIPHAEVPSLLIPTGVPLLYHHDGQWRRDQTRFACTAPGLAHDVLLLVEEYHRAAERRLAALEPPREAPESDLLVEDLVDLAAEVLDVDDIVRE